MKTLFTSLFFVLFAATAQADVVGGLTPMDLKIALDSNTQVVVLDLRTVQGVSCPGSLDLKTSASFDGTVEVTYNNDGNEAILDMMRKVSKTCGEEIFEQLVIPKAICLSFGFESGSVLIDVRNLSSDLEELTVKLPANLNATEITQL